MKTCKTCVHWETSDTKLLSCFSDNHGFCKKSQTDDNSSIMIAICISEGIGGELITREDFRCVLHEKA